MAKATRVGGTVSVKNYAAFRRGLQSLDKGTNKILTNYLKDLAKETTADAKRRAPVKSGKLRKSIRPSVTQKRVTVYSTLPYAGVQEWGGTIRPKGTPIKIEGHHMVRDAVDAASEKTERDLTHMFDVIAGP